MQEAAATLQGRGKRKSLGIAGLVAISGMVAALGASVVPTPAVAGSDNGEIVCLVAVMAGQQAAIDARHQAVPAPVRVPLPGDLRLSGFDAGTVGE